MEKTNERIIHDALVAGMLRNRSDILFSIAVKIDYAYVIQDMHCSHNRDLLLKYFSRRGIFSMGRFGAWKYSSMEDALLDGQDAAVQLSGRKQKMARY